MKTEQRLETNEVGEAVINESLIATKEPEELKLVGVKLCGALGRLF